MSTDTATAPTVGKSYKTTTSTSSCDDIVYAKQEELYNTICKSYSNASIQEIGPIPKGISKIIAELTLDKVIIVPNILCTNSAKNEFDKHWYPSLSSPWGSNYSFTKNRKTNLDELQLIQRCIVHTKYDNIIPYNAYINDRNSHSSNSNKNNNYNDMTNSKYRSQRVIDTNFEYIGESTDFLTILPHTTGETGNRGAWGYPNTKLINHSHCMQYFNTIWIFSRFRYLYI